jgi:hypothetical protein
MSPPKQERRPHEGTGVQESTATKTDPKVTRQPTTLAEAIGPRGAAIRAVIREAVAAAEVRRRRVLQYVDLSERLTKHPLRFAQPEAWNGFVPPSHGPWAGGEVAYNDSPQRSALVEICAEALRRENEAA